MKYYLLDLVFGWTFKLSYKDMLTIAIEFIFIASVIYIVDYRKCKKINQRKRWLYDSAKKNENGLKRYKNKKLV